MKKIVLFITMLAIGISFATLSWAGEIDDLKKEMQKLRQDYESKIQKLQEQLDVVSKNQEERIAQIEETD